MQTAVLENTDAKKTIEQKQVYRAPIAFYENTDAFTVLVELAGADEKAVQVSLDNGVVTIDVPFKVEVPAGSTLKYSEMRLGDYRRVLDFSDEIDGEKIEAIFKNGLLKLTLPKSKGAKTRKIAIKTA